MGHPLRFEFGPLTDLVIRTSGLAQGLIDAIRPCASDIAAAFIFGSFARGDFSARSDMDLLIVLRSAKKSIPDRIEEFLKDCSAYPTDVFPLTEQELRARLKENDPFWTQALKDAIQCYPADRV